MPAPSPIRVATFLEAALHQPETLGSTMTKKTWLVVGVVAFLGSTAAACGSHHSTEAKRRTFQLRIFDAANKADVQVTAADVVRQSARTEAGETAGSRLLYFRLTRSGTVKFSRLTRTLAHRGRRVHRSQRFTVEINHRVYARPMVDYRVFPEGLDASQGLQIAGLRQSVANRLAREIRDTS
jgi:hypothetical protein